MAELRNKDFFTRLKWYLFQIFLILLFLIAAYKVLKVELPSFPWPF